MVVSVGHWSPPLDDCGAITDEEETAPHLLSSRGANPRSTVRFPPAGGVGGTDSGLQDLKKT